MNTHACGTHNLVRNPIHHTITCLTCKQQGRLLTRMLCPVCKSRQPVGVTLKERTIGGKIWVCCQTCAHKCYVTDELDIKEELVMTADTTST